MTCRSFRTGSIFTALFVATAAVALAADAPKQQAPPPMTPEQQAMMAAWQKAMTPGPQHQKLMARAGSWTVTTKMWEKPGAPPQETTGTAERTAILGGRVLSEKVASTMMGMPFEGTGWSGYDNVSGQWWGTWVDNFGTGVMTMTGSCDADLKHCEWKGSFNDPITGKAKVSRMTSDCPSADTELSHFFDVGPDGKEWESMQLTYTRKH